MPIERLDAWSQAPFPVWSLTLLIYSLFRPMSSLQVARRIDLELHLRERLSTAVVFDKAQDFPGYVYAQLIQAQRMDALACASRIVPAKDLPLRWYSRPLATASILLLTTLASALLPNPMDAVLAQRQAVRQEAARQAERVEQLGQRIEQTQELSPEEREELLKQLKELAEQLRSNPGDLEQSVADISNLEKLLAERLDPNFAIQKANLEALAAQLAAVSGAERSPEQSATEAAAEALAELAAQLPNLSAEQQQELALQLAQMAAQAGQSGDAQLAQSLAALAQAFQQGDPQAASQAAQSAQQALSQAQARQAQQNTLQQAIDQLQASRQALAQAAGQGSQQAALSPGQSPSQNPGQNPGNGSGQSGNNQGQPGNNVTGGGSRANTLPPAAGGQGNVRPQGEAPNVAPGELSNQVYAPWQRPVSSGNELFIPGQETGQGETQSTQGQSNLPGVSNPSLVPYQQVFFNYLSAANLALQQSYVPAELSEYIRQYFSQLNP
jgi:uncharacterized protein YfcZ (UPF0381/DUF406 family)